MIGGVSNRTVRKRGAMSTFKPKNLWTAFITAFFALLASLGLATASAGVGTERV